MATTVKLLIITQKVDSNDSDLGFFHRWIEEFAKHCEKVTVICLQEGAHALPPNVEVLSLKKESGSSRLRRVMLFYRYVFSRRKEYDAVFVHMNPEYVVLGGWLWRLWHKKVVLWYVHRSVTLKLRIAVLFANCVATTSKESFRLKSNKVSMVGHGIDTGQFYPRPKSGAAVVPRVLSAGRLSPSKWHDLVMRAAALLPEVQLTVVGAPATLADESYEKSLYALADELNIADRVIFAGARTPNDMPDIYAAADVFAHASTTGSIDKVVLEALACGVPVVSTSEAFKNIGVVAHSAAEPHAFAEAIKKTLASPLDPQALYAYVRDHHSLTTCIQKIMGLYAKIPSH